MYNGSESVVLWSKDNIYVIKTLREFLYVDDNGVDQGARIRSIATELTKLLYDDDRLRQVRLESKGKRGRGRTRPDRNYENGEGRPASEGSRGRSRARTRNGEDDELQLALEESRRTAEEDENRRRGASAGDDDLNKALQLSKEEEEKRYIDSVFQPASQSQPNLIDTSSAPVQAQPFQVQYQAQPIFLQPQVQMQQPGQVDIFGNGFQQPLDTGYIQNMYTTGQAYPGFPQQNQFAFAQQPQQQMQMQPMFGAPQQLQQPQQPEPLQPLKTGSNNPFAKPASSESSFSAQSASLNQIQLQYQQQQQQEQLEKQRQQQLEQQQRLLQQQQQQQQSMFSKPVAPAQPAPPKTAFSGQSSSHLEELNTMLATGEGLDTYGNQGDMRIPAQHTRTTFINSQGMGLQSSNPNAFLGQQYTGVVTTNPIQPAYTGFGFGNAQQSQQSYQQSFRS